jgi:hypothetical protein
MRKILQNVPFKSQEKTKDAIGYRNLLKSRLPNNLPDIDLTDDEDSDLFLDVEEDEESVVSVDSNFAKEKELDEMNHGGIPSSQDSTKAVISLSQSLSSRKNALSIKESKNFEKNTKSEGKRLKDIKNSLDEYNFKTNIKGNKINEIGIELVENNVSSFNLKANIQPTLKKSLKVNKNQEIKNVANNKKLEEKINALNFDFDFPDSELDNLCSIIDYDGEIVFPNPLEIEKIDLEEPTDKFVERAEIESKKRKTKRKRITMPKTKPNKKLKQKPEEKSRRKEAVQGIEEIYPQASKTSILPLCAANIKDPTESLKNISHPRKKQNSSRMNLPSNRRISDSSFSFTQMNDPRQMTSKLELDEDSELAKPYMIGTLSKRQGNQLRLFRPSNRKAYLQCLA